MENNTNQNFEVQNAVNTALNDQKKKKKKKKWIIIAVVALLIVVIAAAAGSGDDSEDASGTPSQSVSNDIENNENDKTTLKEPETEGSKETIGQKNALRKAKSYLNLGGFSKEGLIEQLEFEQFSHEDAVYGAENCGADWNEQAAIKAESYIDIMAFSRDQLIDQLEFDGFTHEQAVHGAESVGY